jgi:antibiotic biosynthesis monooxygenase (ABM) superfamily enzyme
MEALMSVTALNTRKVVPVNEILLEELYWELRKTALTQEGYIGAETIKRVDIEGAFLNISKWQHVDNWSKWLASKERMVFQERIDNLTDAETKFAIYTH